MYIYIYVYIYIYMYMYIYIERERDTQPLAHACIHTQIVYVRTHGHQ